MKYFKQFFLLLFITFGTLYGGDFLMPDEAFKPYAKVNDKMQIEVGVTIAKDIYLYAKELKIVLKDTQLQIKEKKSPKVQKHHGDDVYLSSPNFILTLDNPEKLEGKEEVRLILSYQGCSEMGLCYNLYTKEYKLTIDRAALSGSQELQQVAVPEELSESDAIAESIKSGSIVVVLLTFLGFGLLLALTPCVFPMIPIISGVIVSQGEGLTTRKAFALSVVYVLAMAVAYTIAGVLAGLFGANLQAALQTPWVVYSFSLVFVALALSMFGYYELKLPDALVAKVSKGSSKTGYVGVAIMGFLSALIVGPCVAAPLAGALVYIGQTGDALLGGMALFSMSIGMGLPLIVVGVSAGKFMPKPGAWMNMVSAIFGIMMLAVAIWMLEKVLSMPSVILLYAFLGIGTAIYFGLFDTGVHLFKKSLAVILFIYSLSLFLSFLAGSASLSTPLHFLKGSSASVIQEHTAQESSFKVIHSIAELDTLLEASRGKKVLLDFSAAWCSSCKELEEFTFSDSAVKKKMQEFVLIRADVTKNSAQEKALSKKYGVFGPPAILFFNENHELEKSKTIIGFIEADAFLEQLDRV